MQFVHDVAEVSNGRAACELLGLGNHPYSLKHLKDRRSHHHWKVVYHADPWTNYQMDIPQTLVFQSPDSDLPGVLPVLDDDVPCQRAAFVQHFDDALSVDDALY